jgi:hypothetical protein
MGVKPPSPSIGAVQREGRDAEHGGDGIAHDRSIGAVSCRAVTAG